MGSSVEAIVILAIVGGYLAVAVFTVRAVVRWHAKNGATKTQRWLWGGAVALAFYLVPFWDLLPTFLAHQYLCATQSGFQVNKTIDKWKMENAAVVANLRHHKGSQAAKIGDYRRYPINQRLASERKEPIEVFLTIKRMEGRIVDVATGEVLASYVDFYAPGTGKWWLKTGRCVGENRGAGDFALIERAAYELGGKR